MARVFQCLADRTRARLDVPRLRILFGARARPHQDRTSTARIEAVIETPRYDLTLFKVHFGTLTLKAYTKGEHVLRFEAIVHNTRDLGCGRVLARFPQIITRLQGMVERFLTTLDCLDTAFVPDDTSTGCPCRRRWARPASAGSTSTNPASAPRWRPCSRSPPPHRRHRRPVGRQGPADDRADRP
jgi:hypothetical protein